MHVRGRVCVHENPAGAEGRETEERRMEKRARRTASSPFLPTVEWRVGRGTKREGEEKRTRENTRPWSGGLCEGYEGWCKGDGEAGGSASDEESQRLTKKKGRPLQFIDRPAVRAATRGCARDEAKQRGGPAGFGGGEEFTNDGKSPETTQPTLFFFFFFQDRRAIGVYHFFSLISDVARASVRRRKNFTRRRECSNRVQEPSEFAPPSVSPRG
ncbi:hypothetical protein ALC62_09385 [Cyphomyrmex costatus]|uniref:Uncharacterized protein n=1 Tax=Cyphomyrmex costatus TaxID=456900 RepID=A0A195CGC4_9HYME|nr:hypothetical protein ALC62_09385 [Cyphomyrmex costatus]